MDFLDELISDQQFNEYVDQGLIGRIEIMIWHSSLDDKEKRKLMKQMLNLKSNEDAWWMINYLKQSQPILELERPAITQYEIVEAVRRSADMDDFKEEIRKR